MIEQPATKERKSRPAAVEEAPKAEDVVVPRRTGELLTNEAVRRQVCGVLARLAGVTSNPRFTYHVERADGSFDSADGKVRTAAELGKRRVCTVLIEEK